MRQERVRVLVADDHAPLRQGVRLVLEPVGYEVIEATTADEAVAAAAATRPAVALIDLGMPGGGLTAVERIYEDDPACRLIILTGSIDDEDVFAAVRAGAIGYLVKGIDDEMLRNAVESAAQGDAVLPRRLLMLLAGAATRIDGSTVQLDSGTTVVLTPRETQILAFLKQGKRTREIAAELGRSPITVRRHIGAVLRKLDAPTRDAAVEALDRGRPPE